MARAGNESASNELIQIVLLTLAMTGGGLLVLFLVLHFWMVPRKRDEADGAKRAYAQLSTLLTSDELRTLKAQAKAREAAGEENRAQQDIIELNLEPNGLSQTRIPAPRDLPQEKAQLQSVTLNPAPLSSIFQFIVAVKRAKRSIEVDKISFSQPGSGRNRQSGTYSATIDFIDYLPTN